MNRKDFRPNDSSSKISDRDRAVIRKNKYSKQIKEEHKASREYSELAEKNPKDSKKLREISVEEKTHAKELKGLEKSKYSKNKKESKEQKIKKDIEKRKAEYGDNPSLDIDKKDAKKLGNYYMVEKKPYFVVGHKKDFFKTSIDGKSFDNKTDAENYMKDKEGKVLTRKEYAHYRVKELRGQKDTGKY
jgi:hypothetical protein